MMRSVIRSAGLAAVIGLVGGAAQAADLSAEAEPAPAYEAPQTFSWTGPYIGAHIGYAFGQFETAAAGVSRNIDADGFAGGLLAGINYQVGQFVVGFEGDYTATNFDGTRGFPGSVIKGDVDWMATLRGRAGLAVDRYLVYGTGGLALADISLNGYGSGDGANLTGWTLGAGVEAAVTDNVVVRAEYLYTSFPEKWYNLAGTPARADLDEHTLRLGVAYKFNMF
ncbi:MAG: porin family protein [Hyphomicrobiales bacterium]